jgi:hypothetical protein
MAPPLTDLKHAIKDGQYDSKLDAVANQIYLSIKQRKSVLDDELIENFNVGDQVETIKGNYRPIYFQQRTGTVSKVLDGIVWVDLDFKIVRKSKVIKTVGIRPIYLKKF